MKHTCSKIVSWTKVSILYGFPVWNVSHKYFSGPLKSAVLCEPSLRFVDCTLTYNGLLLQIKTYNVVFVSGKTISPERTRPGLYMLERTEGSITVITSYSGVVYTVSSSTSILRWPLTEEGAAGVRRLRHPLYPSRGSLLSVVYCLAGRTRGLG